MSASYNDAAAQHNVRFAPDDETFTETSLRPVETLTGHDARGQQKLNPQAEQELKQLRTTLQNSVQTRRMEQYAFEPLSLPGSEPASRVRIHPSKSFRCPVLTSDSLHSCHPAARPHPEGCLQVPRFRHHMYHLQGLQLTHLP